MARSRFSVRYRRTPACTRGRHVSLRALAVSERCRVNATFVGDRYDKTVFRQHLRQLATAAYGWMTERHAPASCPGRGAALYWCAADPGPRFVILRKPGSRVCSASLHAALRPGHEGVYDARAQPKFNSLKKS